MTEQGKMIAIAVLCVTAVLLLCTLVIVGRLPVRQAWAGDAPDRQGDYILIPGGNTRGDEVVYVIDVAARKLGAYAANTNSSRIEVKARFDLANLPK